MRSVTIGGNEYKVVASPITLYFYKKEFKRALLGDLMSLSQLEDDPTAFDDMLILQLAWAMIKTAKMGREFSNFEQWLASLEYVDFEDTEMLSTIVEEAREGFFRGNQKSAPVK